MDTTTTEINDHQKARIRYLIKLAIHVLTGEHDGTRLGASFHIRNESKHVLFAERFGNAVEDDACRYDFFASEKTIRLCDHPDHTLSWESRNEEYKQYQGGVRFQDALIAALSGYSAEEDEATTLWVGIQMGWITDSEARKVTLISGNQRYTDLALKFDQVYLA